MKGSPDRTSLGIGQNAPLHSVRDLPHRPSKYGSAVPGTISTTQNRAWPLQLVRPIFSWPSSRTRTWSHSKVRLTPSVVAFVPAWELVQWCPEFAQGRSPQEASHCRCRSRSRSLLQRRRHVESPCQPRSGVKSPGSTGQLSRPAGVAIAECQLCRDRSRSTSWVCFHGWPQQRS